MSGLLSQEGQKGKKETLFDCFIIIVANVS